jgi:hypothetical protein
LAKRDQQELSELALERITRVVRSLAEDRVERGVELSKPMHCDSCDQEKPSAGSSLYGVYKLCNDCLLDFTVALASGKVDTVADFMTRQVDDPGSLPPSDLSQRRDRRTVPLNPLPGREKLLPHHEPS